MLAVRTYGSNDVYAFERFSGWSSYLGAELYRAAWDFNHPPSMLHVFRILEWLASIRGLWFPFWLRLPAILADAGSVWILLQILKSRLHEPSIRYALLMFAAAPALILISGFHGNTDSVMLFFLLLSVLSIEKGFTGRAGAAFGLAVCFKVVPVIALPVVLLYLATRRKQMIFLGSAGVTLLIAWSPYLFQDPAPILRQIFGYSSYYGHWGISYCMLLLGSLAPPLQWLNEFLRRFGSYLLLASIPVVSWFLRRSGASLYAQVGVIFFWFLAFTSGFGVQYLAWLVPWTVGLGAIPSAMFYAVSGAFLFLVYDFWSQGMPWYLADSNRAGDYQGHIDYFQVLCWATTILLLVIAHRQIRSNPSRTNGMSEGLPAWSRISASNRILAMALAGIVFIGAPMLSRLQPPAGNLQARWKEVAAIRSGQYLDLSHLLYQRRRYSDSVKAAETAVNFNPRSAEAYNNMAAAYAAQGDWDLSAASARKALEILPGYELARNNLRWALDHKGADRESPAK